jgi:hypothetical protein
MGRERIKRGAGRDSGGFVALPWSVLDSPAFLALSHPAKALLLEVARQCHGDDNGRLLVSRPLLAARGWKSVDVITRAKQELLDAELIFETVKGQRPNKASWYAVTWHKLGKLQGYDHGVTAAFRQGAYRKNEALRPAGGQGGPSIGPPPGQGKAPPCPSPGPMTAVLGSAPCPSPGHPLEKPSPAPRDADLIRHVA